MKTLFQQIFILFFAIFLSHSLFAMDPEKPFQSEMEQRESRFRQKLQDHFESMPLVVKFLTLSYEKEGDAAEYRKEFVENSVQKESVLRELQKTRHQEFLTTLIPHDERDLVHRGISLSPGIQIFIQARKKNLINAQLGPSAYEFLTYTTRAYEEHFKDQLHQIPVVLRTLLLHKRERALRGFISINGPALQDAISSAKPGLSLCIYESLKKNKSCSSSLEQFLRDNFSNYCLRNGYDAFVEYVAKTNMFQFSRKTLGLCLSTSLLREFRHNSGQGIDRFFSESEESAQLREQLVLNQNLSDAIYHSGAQRFHRSSMTFILAHLQPSQDLENYALHYALWNDASPEYVNWLLMIKPGLKGDVCILEHYLLGKLEQGSFLTVEHYLPPLRDVLRTRQSFIDDAYTIAAAHGNENIRTLIVVNLGRPSQRGKDNAFIHACANGRVKILSDLLENNMPSVAAIDDGFKETITHDQRSAFDFFLKETNIHFSQEFIEGCLKIKTNVSGSREFQIFAGLHEEETYYQTRLRELFDIPLPSRFAHLLSSINLLPLAVTSLHALDFNLPELNFKITDIFVKSDEGAPSTPTEENSDSAAVS